MLFMFTYNLHISQISNYGKEPLHVYTQYSLQRHQFFFVFAIGCDSSNDTGLVLKS